MPATPIAPTAICSENFGRASRARSPLSPQQLATSSQAGSTPHACASAHLHSAAAHSSSDPVTACAVSDCFFSCVAPLSLRSLVANPAQRSLRSLPQRSDSLSLLPVSLFERYSEARERLRARALCDPLSLARPHRSLRERYGQVKNRPLAIAGSTAELDLIAGAIER